MTTYLVTGSNRGIGLSMCRQLKGRGDTVIAVCRKSGKDLDALGVRVEKDVDVTNDAHVAALAKRLEGVKIDVLVNNAGVLVADGLESINFEQLRTQMEINAFGPLRLTKALVPRVPAGGKIIIITSLMGSMGDNGSGGYYGYRMSKAAVNSAGVSLARDLAGRKIAVGILHPGMVATDMTGKNGIPPEDAARGLIARIDELTMERTGKFFHQNGRELPW
jgi:NAD(P)-dependent dehydrogenase (short-subunit alcohol dehydrogenase family)